MLIHRYSFDTPGAAEDTATGGTRGGAPELLHGTLVGTATVSGGSLRTNGEANGKAYVALPAGVTATLNGSFTIQQFATPEFSAGFYQTLSAFTKPGDDNHDGSRENLLISQPVRNQGGSPSAFGYRQEGVNGGNEWLLTGSPGDTGGTMHTFTTTFDAEAGTARYYRDGVLVATSATGALAGFDLSQLTQIGINGRAPWNDPSLSGSTQEFRIYRGLLTPQQVAATVANPDLTSAEFEAAGIDVPGGAPALVDRTVVQSSRWHPSQILAWSPATDPLAPYNRSVVPLAERFTAPKASDNPALNALWNVNPHARPEEARVQAVTTFNTIPAGMPNGFRTTRLYAPSMWQYLDSMAFWGSSDRDDRVIMCPTAHTIDAAHRNGVRIYGKIFFHWNASPDDVALRRIRDLIQKDGDTFPVADKLIEAALYYGFDGWFLNQENYQTNSADAQGIRDFMAYFRARSEDMGASHLKMEWYDAMAENGNRSFQNALTNSNDGFMKSGTNVTDTGSTLAAHEMFLNFWWYYNSSNLSNSRALALSRGIDPYDLFAGIWTENYRNYGKTPDPNSAGNLDITWSHLFPEGAPHNTSVGLFAAETPWFKAPFPAGGVAQDQIYWSGPNSDPTDTVPAAGSPTPNWYGLAHYIPANSVITRLPFVTNFNVGQGSFYKIDGTTVMTGPWTNLGVQDILPTWRWIVTSTGAETLTPSLDFTESYYGGSSLKVTGSLQAGVAQEIKLYQTRLPITSETSLKLIYKPGAVDNSRIQVGFAFEDAPGTMVYSNAARALTTSGWSSLTVPMSAYAGRSLALITLRFSSPTTLGSYTTAIGRIQVSDGPMVAPQAPSALVLEGTMPNPDEAFSTTLRLKWAASPSPVLYYNIYHRRDDAAESPRVWLGATANDHFVAQDVRRFGTEAAGFIDVEAVGPDHGTSAPATTPGATFEFEPYPNLHRPLIPSYPVSAPITVIGSGTNPANMTRAFDNNTANFTEPGGADNAWVGIDLGAGNAAKVTAVRFFPRANEANRMLYGRFQGSNTADFSSGVVELVRVETRPLGGVYTTLTVSDPGTFRYLRYLSPNGGWANVAEIKFYGDGDPLPAQPPLSLQATVSGSTANLNWLPALSGMTNGYHVLRSTVNGGDYTTVASGVNATSWQDSGLQPGTIYYYRVVAENELGTSEASSRLVVSPPASRKLGGSVIGTNGSWNNLGDDKFKVFDGNPGTFFDAVEGDGAWAGLDLGSPKKITSIRYSPRNADNWLARMVGGVFQAADNPAFTNPVTLFVVPSIPVIHTYTIASVEDVPSYRYVRYLSPSGAHCNISEAEFYGVTVPTAPSAVAISPQPASAELEWISVATAVQYRVKRATTIGGPYQLVGETLGTRSYDDQGLDPYTTYYYVVSAVNEAGESPPSSEVVKQDAYGAWLIAAGGTLEGPGSGFDEKLDGTGPANGARYMMPDGVEVRAAAASREVGGVVRNDPNVTVSLWRSDDLTGWAEVPFVDSSDQSNVDEGFRRVGAVIEGPFDGQPVFYRFEFIR